jgi:hypothetical protein
MLHLGEQNWTDGAYDLKPEIIKYTSRLAAGGANVSSRQLRERGG